MKRIEDLRDKHKGEEIWIVGTGPSLDDVPDDFFDGKISIGLGFTVVAFPRLTYVICYHKRNMEFFHKDLKIFKRAILCYPNEIVEKPEEWHHFGELPIWMAQSGHGYFKTDKEAMRLAVEAIKQARSVEYKHKYTHAHLAIQAAAILGAARISLVACQHSYIPQPYAQKRGLSEFYNKSSCPVSFLKERQKELLEVSKYQKEGTAWLAEALGNQGIAVEEYDLNKGYVPIPKMEDSCLP